MRKILAATAISLLAFNSAGATDIRGMGAMLGSMKSGSEAGAYGGSYAQGSTAYLGATRMTSRQSSHGFGANKIRSNGGFNGRGLVFNSKIKTDAGQDSVSTVNGWSLGNAGSSGEAVGNSFGYSNGKSSAHGGFLSPLGFFN